MKEQVINSIEKNKIIAILRGIADDDLIDVAEALYEGGIRLLEITYSANGSVSDEHTAQNIHRLVQRMDGRMMIGAGTVITKKQVVLTQRAGGQFIISPNTDKSVIRESNRRGLVSIPGALTPSEIADANRYGADFVKLFPITNLGVGYIKAVRAPLSHVKMLAVGGINDTNMGDYLAAGVCGFGVGSNITDKKLIEAKDWAGIAALARRYTEGIQHG